MAKRAEMDLTTGPIFKKLFLYAVPFIFTNILQVLFNAADVAIVGIFVDDNAVAAVGANSTLISLLISLFIGLSMGSNVVLSRYTGAKDKESARRTVGTSIAIALISGVFLMIVGVALARELAILMKCDSEILDQAVLYLRIYFLGTPIMLLYNFSASILRAAGDTRRPLIFLSISGVVNVLLNVFFVTVCKMTVEGVALATIASWAISAFLCLYTLFKSDGYASLGWKYIRLYKKQMNEILVIGIPSGLQSIAFSISNVLIQSTVNGYGAAASSANTAGAQFDGIVYNVGNAISMSCMAFVGQNVGARNSDRIKKVMFNAILLIMLLQFSVGALFALFAPQLCSIIASSSEVIELASIRMRILATFYFLCGIMEIFSNSCRAMGKPVVSFIVSVFGAVVFRVAFMKIALLIWTTYETIYWSYPASWIFTILMHSIFVTNVYKKLKAKFNSETLPSEQAV